MNWIPDHTRKECMQCKRKFSMVHRKHHCRNCGALVCDDCSKNKWFLKGKNERVCNKCFKLLTDKQPIISPNPTLQILKEPSFFTWISTFEKYWIKTKYPEKYKQLKKELEKNANPNYKSNKKVKNHPKPSNATLKDKISNSIRIHHDDNKAKSPKQLTKQNSIGHQYDPGDPIPPDDITTTTTTTTTKPAYKRHIKSKYDIKPPINRSLSVSNYLSITKNPLIVVRTGVLWINIMEALGVPDCDAFSKPDCYVVFYCVNNDPCFGKTAKYSTKVEHNTYTPEWHHDEIMVLTNNTGKLIIELWDYDIGDKDDLLGSLSININDLFVHFECNQDRFTIIDEFFEIKLADQYKKIRDKRAKNREKRVRKLNKSLINGNKQAYINPYNMALLKDKYNTTTRILQIPPDDDDDCDPVLRVPVYRRIGTLNSVLIPEDFEKRDPFETQNKCFVHLQLKIQSFGFWGNFISHFDPLMPPKPKTKPFNVNIFYGEIQKLLALLWPIVDSSKENLDIVLWTRYVWSTIYLLFYGWCVFNPWFAVFYIQFRSLIYICHSYVKQTVLSGGALHESNVLNLPTPIHWICVVFGIIPCLFKAVKAEHIKINNKNNDIKIDPKTNGNDDDSSCSSSSYSTDDDADDDIKDKDDNDDQKDEEEINMGAFTTFVGRQAVKVSGMKSSLAWYQELLIFTNETIDYICKLFNWSTVSITMCIAIFLFVSCLSLIILRNTQYHQYQLLIIGSFILSFYSKPIQFLIWTATGTTSFYYSFHAPSAKWKIEIQKAKQKTKQNTKSFNPDDELDWELEDLDENDDEIFNKNRDIDEKEKRLITRLFLIIYDKINRIWEIFVNLIFGTYQFIRPVLDTNHKNKHNKHHKHGKLKKQHHTHFKSQSSPNLRYVGNGVPNGIPKLHPDTVSLPPAQVGQLYLSEDAISHGLGRSVKTGNEVRNILRRKSYTLGDNNSNSSSGDNKSKKHNFFNNIFHHNKDNDSPSQKHYLRRSYSKKQKQKQKKKYSSTKKSPTLLRKKSLQKIENKADIKIKAMMDKLNTNKI